jgi:hypothetical protein
MKAHGGALQRNELERLDIIHFMIQYHNKSDLKSDIIKLMKAHGGALQRGNELERLDIL